MEQVKIFDTTLRDGEQSPGCSMNLREKIEVAKCLEKMHVDIIEAGFAIASPGDFESVKTISETIRECTIASLARSTPKDIDTAWIVNVSGSSPDDYAECASRVDVLEKICLNMDCSIDEIMEIYPDPADSTEKRTARSVQ